MEMTRRLLGSSAIVTHPPEERDISVKLDISGFVRRLLLFDTYVLYSIRLKEVPELVRHFGYQGTMDLLSSGALEIRHECAQYAEGQFNTPPYPELTFQFHVIEAHIWEQYLIDSLPEVGKAPGLTAHERMELQSAVVRAVTRSDNRQMFAEEIAPDFEREILHNERLVKRAVLLVLSKDRSAIEPEFTLKIHKVGDDRYQAETDLHHRLNVEAADIHNAVKTALLGISGMFQRIGEMKAHVALSGFTKEELPLFRAKLGSFTDAIGSWKHESRFQRVISLTGLPEIARGQRIDIQRVLQIRDEPEAIEFRGWLADIDKLQDREIKDRIASLNARIGLVLQRGTGKAVRLFVTIVPGIAHPVLGTALSVLDTFIWDKFFKRSGVAAFVNELYPSIFRNQPERPASQPPRSPKG
jgi:hypothetical protein